MKIVLGLTHDCNLSCSYCYAGNKFQKNMSFEVAMKIVDFTLNLVPSNQKIEYSFFGGEPLLCMDLIKSIIAYIKQNAFERKLSFSITSNGTIITDEILEFISIEGINLCISIDGPEFVHNKNRKLPNGQGSFNLTIGNLLKAQKKLPALQVNAVYSQNTIDYLVEIIRFFCSVGISNIHINPNITETWEEIYYPKINGMFQRLAEEYIRLYESGYELSINCLDSKIILFLKGGYQRMDLCGMGETLLGFAPSGNIYPCERFISEDNDFKYRIGNINTGFDPSQRCKIIDNRGNKNEMCLKCNLQKYCMNWCGCTNYYMTNYTDLVGPLTCEIEKAIIQAAKHAFITLKNNNLFLSHYMKYAQEGYHYHQ